MTLDCSILSAIFFAVSLAVLPVAIYKTFDVSAGTADAVTTNKNVLVPLLAVTLNELLPGVLVKLAKSVVSHVVYDSEKQANK